MTDTKIPRLVYFPQLSGARFLAVLFVLVYHFFAKAADYFKTFYDLGTFVTFFFVLSSFLITRILLNSRIRAGLGESRRRLIGRFLGRRTLRIFPAYYAYLILLCLLPWAGLEIRQHAAEYFAYLSNFLVYAKKNWEPFVAAHLWTLAVEEQFYLLWPFVLLFVPERWLARTLAGFIGLAVVFRMVMAWRMPDSHSVFAMLVLTPSCLDSFAAGALLALAYQRGYTRNRWLAWLAFASVPVWICVVFFAPHIWAVGFDRLFVALCSVAIIDQAIRGYSGLFGRLLEHPVSQYLAQISYGIYLYHLLVLLYFPKVVDAIVSFFAAKGLAFGFLRALYNIPVLELISVLGITIGVATLSWYGIEQPFTRFSRKVIR